MADQMADKRRTMVGMSGGESKTRRDYDTGSVFQKCEPRSGCPPMETGPDGEKYRPEHDCKGRWMGQFDAGYTKSGGRRRPTVSAKTEAQVKVKLRKRMNEFADGAASVNPKTTVKKWAEEWLALVERTDAPSTHNNTRSSVKVWIVPTIGHKRLADLTPADVRSVGNAQRKEKRKTSTITRTHSVLLQLLKAARAEGYAVPSRVVEVVAPRPNTNDKADIPVDSAVAMLKVAAAQPDGSRWVAAFLQGLRPAERRGLTWAAIDFERNLIEISWQLQPLPYTIPFDTSSGFRVPDGHESVQVRGRWHLVRPKTSAGWRIAPMTPWMRSALLAWREKAPENAAGLVWPRESGDFQKVDDAEWHELQNLADVRHPTGRYYTPHETRHTTATLLADAGVAPEVIAAILGQNKLVRTYIHRTAIAPLADALGEVAKLLALP